MQVQSENTTNTSSRTEKAAYFINVAVPASDGKTMSLPSIGLKLGTAAHAAVIDFITNEAGEVVEEQVSKLKDALIIDARSAAPVKRTVAIG